MQTAALQQDLRQDGPTKEGIPEKGAPGDTVPYFQPRYKEGSRPVYPGVAQRRGYEGTVLVEAVVLETGELGQARIVTSSGFDILDEEALRWVNSDPFVDGPSSEKRTYLVPVTFTLDPDNHLARDKER
jgi:protein TonB